MAPLSDNSRPNKSTDDLATLQGVWEQVGLEENGISNPPDDHGAPGALTFIRGNHFEVRTAEGELLLEGGFTLDASTTPKSITWVDSIGSYAATSELSHQRGPDHAQLCPQAVNPTPCRHTDQR